MSIVNSLGRTNANGRTGADRHGRTKTDRWADGDKQSDGRGGRMATNGRTYETGGPTETDGRVYGSTKDKWTDERLD